MIRWQDEVSSAEWDEWQKIARRASALRGQFTSLGAEDFAAQTIEKLLMQENRPANVKGWIYSTIRNAYIDHWRKVSARGGEVNADIDDLRYANELKSTLLGPKSAYMVEESAKELLGFLSEQHQKLILMKAAGFEADEIAEELGYSDPRAVSNTLRRIKHVMEERLGRSLG